MLRDRDQKVATRRTRALTMPWSVRRTITTVKTPVSTGVVRCGNDIRRLFLGALPAQDHRMSPAESRNQLAIAGNFDSSTEMIQAANRRVECGSYEQRSCWTEFRE